MIAINAKYIHTSLAVRSIKTYCDKLETKIDTREFTINNDEDSIINEVYDLKPDLLGISCYIWNIELVLNVVSSVKKILPNIKIFLGGPEVSYNYNYLFEKNIDVVCIGEGEQTVQQLVELFNQEKEINDKFGNIKGIAFKLDDKIINTEARDLLDLNDIPFVYSDINMSDDTHRILYYEASRGCPYNCQYCLSSLEKGLRFLDDERVCSDLQFFLDNNVKQVKFVDRTFNCNKRYAMLIWGYLIKNDNGVTNFHFEISADILDDDMLCLLKTARAGLFQFEIGVQSTNDLTLSEIQRKTNLDKLFNKVIEIKSFGNIHQHLDLIAGLPFEDYNVFKNSFNDVFSLYPEQFQLGFLKLLKGSGLRENADKYGIVYKENAPYEVLFTNYIDYKTMCFIKNIEELVEIYYNSGKAINTLRYLISFYETPFELFEAFVKYWDNNDLFSVSHSKMNLYKILFEFGGIIRSVDATALREIIKFDILLNDNIKSLPDWLASNTKNIQNIQKDFYSNPENIQKYLSHLSGYNSKQLARMCYLAEFEVDMQKAIESDFKEVVIIANTTTFILIDYYSKNDLVYKSSYYFLDI